jgi:transposase
MELLHRRCCGLDVHKETVVACLRLVSDGKVTTEVRTFQTTTADLLRLSEWLAANGCTHVAMEATGVYWKPVWHILDDGEFTLVLANAAHVKNVPGRKTDVNDAMWNLAPFRTAVDLVRSIPGFRNLGAHGVVSAIGIDMSRFPSAAHLRSWACACPRNDESAGKRRSNRLRPGGTWLKTTLVQCAWAAVKKKGSYLQALFYRIRARRGPQKAIMVVVAAILTAIYHMLKNGTPYHDLGADHFARRSADQHKNRLVKRLADLGYAVELKPLAA